MNKNLNKIYFGMTILLFIIVLAILCFFSKNKNESENINTASESNAIQVEKVSSYNNPIIPEGFKKVETNSASWELKDGIPIGWNDGLVIEDENGNQFVWVPIDIKNTNFEDRDLKYNYAYNKNNMDYTVNEDLQILKYEGFYIARYEAGIPKEIYENVNEFSKETNNVEGIPVSKKDQIVWNYIDWNMAKNNSTKMYHNKSVESDLVTTKQWFCTMKWLEEKGYDIENSVEWGNYSNNNFKFTGYYSTDYGKTYKYGENLIKQTYNMILSTGATERNKSNNIYDLAGNVSEFVNVHKWINGYYGEEESYYCWGGYYDNISYYSADSCMPISTANSRQGFRVVLYLK